MNSKKAFLLLNGKKPKQLPDLSVYALVCVTDGAYAFLKEKKITPNFICGDFDSLKYLPDEVPLIHTPDQEFTDFHKALQILKKKGFTIVDVFGASGGEQDHFLGNLHTALTWKNTLNITFYDDHGVYYLAEKEAKIENCLGKKISLVPFFEATGISTHGLQFPLKNETLEFSKRIGTRNKAIANTVEISFSSGDLFLFIND